MSHNRAMDLQCVTELPFPVGQVKRVLLESPETLFLNLARQAAAATAFSRRSDSGTPSGASERAS